VRRPSRSSQADVSICLIRTCHSARTHTNSRKHTHAHAQTVATVMLWHALTTQTVCGDSWMTRWILRASAPFPTANAAILLRYIIDMYFMLMRVHVYVHRIYIHEYKRNYIRVFICIHMLWACVCILTYIYIYIYIGTYTYIHVNISIYAHTHTCIRMHMYTRKRTHTNWTHLGVSSHT